VKIVLISKENSASFQFYSACLQSINNQEGFCFDAVLNSLVEYSKYDVILFMDIVNDSSNAKFINKKVICGVVDPREKPRQAFKDIDFLIANGVESQTFFGMNKMKSFIYPVYPVVPSRVDAVRKNNSRLILGYHGNKIHLEGMLPKVTNALKILNKEFPLELNAMYDIKRLGESNIIAFNKLGFPVNHIQYSLANYAKYISISDIGLVPQLQNTKLEKIINWLYKATGRDKYNYFSSYKTTTNLGRHFIFNQYKIPVVTDVTPSSVNFIKNGDNGFFCYGEESWFNALEALAKNKQIRKKIGNNGFESWRLRYSHDNLNTQLLDFLKSLRVSL